MSRWTRSATSSVIVPSFRSARHGLALGVEELAAQSLEVDRACLDAAVVVAVVARPKAIRAEPVRAPHPLEGVVPDPVFVRELLEAFERGLGRTDARLCVLALGRDILRKTQRADQQRQREALSDERDEDDDERQEDDQIASGHIDRERERGGEGDRTADTRPRR